MSELLPCPFCGGTPNISETDYGLCRWVWCEKCEADGPCIPYVFEGTNEEARAFVIEKWNTRQVPKIKPLVWVKDEDGIYEANTPFGYFWVEWTCPRMVEGYCLDWSKEFPSIAEAKAACEQEYERRVRECLE